MKNYKTKHLRSLLLCTFLFCVSLSGCASTRYYEDLPEARSGILAYHDAADPDAKRAVLITRRLLSSRPIPAERVFVISSNLKNPKTGKQIYSLEDNAGALRCGQGKPPRDGCIHVGMKLIQNLSDDALAGVLAHELGHLEKGHIGSALVKRSLGVAQQAPSICTASANPAVTLVTCGIGLGLSLAGYGVAAQGAEIDRNLEKEADDSAWERLGASGYCAGRVMKTTFAELSRLVPQGGKGGVFATHPSYKERWENADPKCGNLATATGNKEQKKATPTTRPPWLNAQRILDESQLGQKLKSELRSYTAERQKQIDAKEVEIKALKQKLTDSGVSSPEQDENLKKEMLIYTELVRRLKEEVQGRKAMVLGQFNTTIDEALAQLSNHGFEEKDPNTVLIQFLDQHPELGSK